MRLAIVVGTLLIFLIRGACAQEEEPNPDINYLSQYLGEMSEKLDFYVTFEDRPDAQGATPWLAYLKDNFTPDLEVATIDALVAKLDEELEGVKVIRSTTYPSVVHLIAEDLLVEGYVMEDEISVEYSGIVTDVPDEIGMLVNGKVQSPAGYPIGLDVDLTTEVVVDVENKTIRDVLTGAVPLVPARRFLWESTRRDAGGTTKVEVFYFAPDEDPEE